MSDLIGHNGGPSLNGEAGEGMQEAKMRFVQIHIGDFLNGIRELTLPERGFYATALFTMYDRMGPMPEDDRQGALLIGCDVRTYRKLKARLVELGKVFEDAGRIYNKRVENEIERFIREARNRRESALDREVRKRRERSKQASDVRIKDVVNEVSIRTEIGQRSAEDRPDFAVNNESLQRSDLSGKPNKINGCTATTVAEACHDRAPTLTLTNKKEEEEKKVREDAVAKATGAGAPSRSLQELVWDEGLAWLRRSGMEEARLRPRLGRWVQEYGAGAVLNAIAQAQKQSPVDPLSYVESILRKAGKSLSERPSRGELYKRRIAEALGEA